MRAEPGLVVTADPIRLRQAISNLMINALQHTPAGGRIRLEVARADGVISISVRDSGPGFGAEVVDVTSGTGLGLVIVEAIVRGHGGMVEVGAAAAGGVVTLVLPGTPEGVEIVAAVASPRIG